MPNVIQLKSFRRTSPARLTVVLTVTFGILLPILFSGSVAPQVNAQDAGNAAGTSVTQLSMSGEPGDYIGGTTSYFYQAGDGTFSASASDRTGDGIPDYIQLSFNGTNNGHWWYLAFSTNMTGKNLVPGFYDNAERAPFASSGHPGLDIDGDGRGCNTVAGNFRIHEAEYDTSTSPPRVVRFTASFEQHCEGGPAALLGTIYYNYSGSAPTHDITGRLAQGDGTGTGGVQVVLSGSQTATAMSDAGGNFSFPNLIEGGNYRLTPAQAAGYVISPQTTSVKALLADESVSFTTVPLYSLGGQVTNSSGAPLTGVTVALNGSATASTATDNNGNYNFTGLRADGNYTVTPSKYHYGFSPPSSTFSTLPSNQTANFVGSLLTHSISGRVIDNFGVGIAGVTMNLSGSLATTMTTDSNGNYSFGNLTAGGNYTVTPVMKYFNFRPVSSSFYDLAGNWGSGNFTGTRATYAISGLVLDGSGNPMVGAVLTLGGTQTGRTVTDSGGNYSFSSLPAGGNYTVSVSKWNYVFNPSNRASSDLSGNNSLNFVGTLDPTQFFVRQHYADFLNREPDAAGLQFWTNNIESCGADAQCREVKRVDTSAAFFLSIEFQQTGYLVYKMYKAAFGNLAGAPVAVQRGHWLPDTQSISVGVVVGQTGWEQRLESNKQAYAVAFVQRAAFQQAHGSQDAATLVNSLFANAGVTPTQAERDAAVSAYNSAGSSNAAQAAALRSVAESDSVSTKLFNEAFVLMQYFGYLQRDPNAAPDSDFSGYQFWLAKLNQFDGNYKQAEMVKAFISSTEYGNRFGQ